MTTDREWLENLKEGDEVVVSVRTQPRITKVARFTATQIITEAGWRFGRKDGHSIGADSFYYTVLKGPATPEAVAAIASADRKRSLVRRLAVVTWSSLPLETLEKINDLLPKEGS